MSNRTAVTSKWIKTKVLMRSASARKHIPTTQRLTKESLRKLLHRYRMVYVKPVSGSLGVGVMRIDRMRGKWVVHEGSKRIPFTHFHALYRWLHRRKKGKAYLVQRGIHVLRLGGRPIDFRVMIQKGRKLGWKVTGTAARVAHPRKAVTNGSQGGSIYAARALLRRLAGRQRESRISATFGRLAHSTANRFGKVYPRMKELGLDVAVDRKYRTWILEVNTRPDPCPFAMLRDGTMLRRIVRFARGYGRHYRLHCTKARRGGG